MKIYLALLVFLSVAVVTKSKKPSANVCYQSVKRGPCNGYYNHVWYYNRKLNKCLPFKYGGCWLQGNSFKSKYHCWLRCVKKPKNQCSFRKNKWYCNGKFIEYYHTSKHKPKNICLLEKEKGYCYGNHIRYFFNYKTGKCEKFLYGGCGGNENRFDSKYYCEKRCGYSYKSKTKNICWLRKEKGYCHGKYIKYHYNYRKGKCEKFIYGGCGGNDNNFDSKYYCEKRCGYTYKSKSKDICLLDKEKGYCHGKNIKYYYNYKKGSCDKFIYGGCGGNENRFDSKYYCEKRCGHTYKSKSKDICLLDKEKGYCHGKNIKYYYNYKKGSCEKFIYGGCGGNGNRFDSKYYCEKRCGHTYKSKSKDICWLKKEKGYCHGKHIKYYYNYKKGKCEKFVYGGCGGNENRFDSKYKCEDRCGYR